jgi:hypothetical protein
MVKKVKFQRVVGLWGLEIFLRGEKGERAKR